MASLTSPSPVPSVLLLPFYPRPIPLADARVALPPDEFRSRLRAYLLDRSDVTLAEVATELGVSRQRVGKLVGPLARPDCADPARPRLAPRKEAARGKLDLLAQRVAAGESAQSAAESLGISVAAAARLGFRVRAVRPVHGSGERAAAGCACWRCRKAGKQVADPASKDS